MNHKHTVSGIIRVRNLSIILPTSRASQIIQKVWKGTNKLIKRSKSKDSKIIQLKINNAITNDSKMIADHCNK